MTRRHTARQTILAHYRHRVRHLIETIRDLQR
jgi:hypothetical protein